jgi:hypothetical protein
MAGLFAAAFAGNMTNNSLCLSPAPCLSSCLKQFQEKWETVFRPELRQNKEIERFRRFRETMNRSTNRSH